MDGLRESDYMLRDRDLSESAYVQRVNQVVPKESVRTRLVRQLLTLLCTLHHLYYAALLQLPAAIFRRGVDH
jgi:hypothetical protein